MPNTDPETIISQALANTFAGNTERDSRIITGIPYEISTFRDRQVTVVDKWIGGSDLTAGQEIVLVNEKPVFVRQYLGGTLNARIATINDLNPGQVLEFLATVLKEFANVTRLGTDLDRNRDPWVYEYRCTDSDEELGITTGKEKIYYKGELVFIHNITFMSLVES